MTPSTITTAVTKAVPGLTDARFRVIGTDGYFIATRDGRGITVIAEHIHVRSVASVVSLIVADLTRKVAV